MDVPPSFDDSRLQHIRHVIREQFGSELTYKEGELEQIEDRIRLAKLMLQRLRLGVLAQHYGVAGFYPTALDFSEENVGVQSSWASFEQEFLKKQSAEEGEEGGGEGEVRSKDSEAPDASGENSTGRVATPSSSALSTTVSLPLAPSVTVATSTMMIRGKPLQSLGETSSHLLRDYRARKEFVLGPVPPSKKHESAVPGATTSAVVPMDTSNVTNDIGVMKNGEVPTNSTSLAPPPQLAATMATAITTPSDIHATPSPLPLPSAREVEGEVTRFYSKKRIIVGNTSQYLHPAASSQENMDGSTHKWMCYVRGPHQDPDISNFVKAVRFFLHPSYHPNDIIRVTRPPFHLIRLGWGEFPLRVQLEFCDRRNKPVDIIHNLVLDRTHTGQQTLGAETVVDLDINPRKEGLAVCSGPNGLNHPLMNGHFSTNGAVNSTTSTSTTTAIAKEGEEAIKISIDRNVIKPLSQQAGANLKVSVMNPGGSSVSKEAGLSDVHQSVMRTSRESSIFSIKSSEHSDSTTASYLPLSTSASPLVEIKPDTSATTNTTITSHNIATIPPNPTLSLSGGKITQPQVLTTNLEKCLHSAVRMVPLYGRPSSSEDFHLTAYSVEQFKSWSIGRRRASEWMRALAVKRHVERKLKLGKSSLLSTKQVMQWCRRNGYTLLDPCVPKGVGFCKYCGCQLEVAIRGEDGKIDESAGKNGHHLRVHERCRETYENTAGGLSHCHDNDDSSLLSLVDMEGGGGGEGEENEAGVSNQKQGGESSSLTTAFRPLSTLSGSEHIFTDLIERQEQIEREEATRVEDELVDVETQPGCTSARARGYEHPIPRLRVPQTPELKWVQQTAASLGINIFPAVIDRMYAHVVEHMVYMSCTRFLKAILMQALQEAGRRVEGDLPSERVLTPLHVFQAIQSLDQCDFLTNKHLGLEAKKLNEEGGVSDDQLSSSCSSSDDEG